MPTVVNLPPDIEGRVIAEAARVGVTPERLVADLLERQLAAEAARIAMDKRAAAIAFLNSWLASADSEEPPETCDAFLLALDANRPGQRQLFPPEAKGRTW